MFRSHLLAIAALGAPVSLAAQGADRGAFVARLGSDTLAVERYSRTGSKFESDIAARIPMTRRLHYTGTLNPGGGDASGTVTWCCDGGPTRSGTWTATIVTSIT